MHPISPTALVVLALVGLASGFVNTVAGAGSLLSLRALMLLGALPGEANGTNRIPVVAQSATAAFAFRKHARVGSALLLTSLAPAAAGAVVGSLLSLVVPDRFMNGLLIVVLFAVAVLGLRKSKRGNKPAEESEALELARMKQPTSLVWLFFSGLYGGFLQAGVGLLLLHAFSQVAGLSLVRSNALKVTVVLGFSLVAAGIFIANGQVIWAYALPLSLGSVVGAALAVRFAISFGEKLKIAVVIVDFLACVVLLARELTTLF